MYNPLLFQTSANGASTAVTGTLMPVISARSSGPLSGNSTTSTYVLATTIPSTAPTASAILVQGGNRPPGVRPTGTATSVTNARPYVIPQNPRSHYLARPPVPGQKVLIRPGGKPNSAPSSQNQVVFVVNNQKK